MAIPQGEVEAWRFCREVRFSPDAWRCRPEGRRATTTSTDPLPPSGTLFNADGGIHTAPINYSGVLPTPMTPFFDGTNFSFRGFCNSYGISNGIQACYVLLGWNGMNVPNYPNAADHANNAAAAQAFIQQLHAEYPGCLVRVLGLEVPSCSGGLGEDYGATLGYSDYYGLLRSANGWNLAMQQMCSTNTPWARFIDIAAQFDSENNMQAEFVPVNTRSSTTELRGSNGVHPSIPGYYQIADAAWRDFIASFCQ